MSRTDKVGFSLLAICITIISYLAQVEILNPPYWTSNVYLRLRPTITGDTSHFQPGNIPFHESYLIVVKQLLNIPSYELVQLPVAGIVISVVIFVFVADLTGDLLLGGLAVTVSTMTVSRSVWTYGYKHPEYALLFVLVLLFILLYSRPGSTTFHNQILFFILLTAVTMNLWYYSAGGWMVVFLGLSAVFSFFLNKNLRIQTLQRQSGLLTTCFVFFVWFTPILYHAVPSMIATSSGESSTQIIGILSQLLGGDEAAQGLVYGGSRFTNPLIARTRIYLKGAYILILAIPATAFGLRIVSQIFRHKVATVREIAFFSLFVLIFIDIMTYLLIGTLVLRSYFYILPVVLIVALREIWDSAPDWVSIDVRSAQVLFAILCLLISTPLFGLTVYYGGFNHADRTDIEPASDWIANFGNKKQITSDLHSLSYAVLDNEMGINRFDRTTYQQLVGRERMNDEYILLNINSKHKPITSGLSDWALFDPLENNLDAIRSNNGANKIYTNRGAVIYRGR